MENTPLVSVCIPTRNGEEFLREALDSLKRQTFKNLEVVISDDESEDDTLSIIKDFQMQANFPVHHYSHKPSTIGANWNNCLNNCSGKYIKFLFQDDIIYPNCIEKLVRFMESNRKVGLVSSKRELIIEGEVDENLKEWLRKYRDLQKTLKPVNKSYFIITHNFLKSSEFRESPLNKIGEPSCVLFRKSILKKAGFFRTDLKQILDYEFYYRLLKINDIAVLNEKLTGFRIHSKQTTNLNRKVKIDDYEVYNKILYDDFFYYLNFTERKRLFLKYHFLGKVYKRLRDVAK